MANRHAQALLKIFSEATRIATAQASGKKLVVRQPSAQPQRTVPPEVNSGEIIKQATQGSAVNGGKPIQTVSRYVGMPTRPVPARVGTPVTGRGVNTLLLVGGVSVVALLVLFPLLRRRRA